ncbi:MAG: hypothetical protein J5667_02375 [Bacteroidales bacterium]|nr:hypothetical protein [Bacteroidales bacterium]
MYKSYWLSLLFCLLTLGIVGYTRIDDARDKEAGKDQTVKYSVVFNAATLEQKIIGLPYDEITKRYEPAEKITGKKKSGYFSAHYTDLQIFTKGEEHIVRDMTVQFKNGIAASLKLDKADERESLCAKVLNLNPLAFKMIDTEFGTREVAVMKGNAEGALKYLVIIAGILFILLVGAGGFFIIWPLLTLIVKKIGGWGARVLGLALVLGISWLWFPFVAYSMDNIGLYLGVGGLVEAIGLIGLFTGTPKAPKTVSLVDPYWGRYLVPVPHDIAMNHIENLWYLLLLDPDTDTGFDLHVKIANELHISDEDYGTAINKTLPDNYYPRVYVPSSPVLREEFQQDYCHIILDGKSQVKMTVAAKAGHLATGLGFTPEEFISSLRFVAEVDYDIEGEFLFDDTIDTDPDTTSPSDEPSDLFDSMFEHLKK